MEMFYKVTYYYLSHGKALVWAVTEHSLKENAVKEANSKLGKKYIPDIHTPVISSYTIQKITTFKETLAEVKYTPA